MSEGEALRHLLPCDTCPQGVSLTVQLTEIDSRLDRMDIALFGDGNKPGIVDHVETLVQMTHVGRSTLRVFVWFGATLAGLITVAYQAKQFFAGMLH